MRKIAARILTGLLFCAVTSCGAEPTPAPTIEQMELRLLGSWSGSLDHPPGSECVEGCHRGIDFRPDHTFLTSDGCPGYQGSWNLKSDGAITLQGDGKDYADEDGVTACAAGTEFKPASAGMTGSTLKVSVADGTIEMEKDRK